MKYRGLTRNQIRVHKALNGGAKFDELMARLKDKPGSRQVRTILRQLEAKGWVYDARKGQRGSKAHTWFPKEGTCEDVHVCGRGAAARMSHEALAVSIYESAWNATTAIRACSRCRDRDRIRDVCDQYLRPVSYLVEEYRTLTDADGRRVIPSVKLPTVAEFLTEPMHDDLGEPVQIRKSRGAQARKGTVSVRHPKSNSTQDSFKPTLGEWDQYLAHITWLLRKVHLAHSIREYRRVQEQRLPMQ